MSGHGHRHRHPSHQSHAARHPRRAAAEAGAAAVGVGAAASPLLSERAGKIAEEALGHVPKPMLAGLAAGLVIGAPLGYLYRTEHTPTESHAAKIEGDRDQVDRLRR